MDEEQPQDAGREWSRILLICCCVLAAIAVGALVGSFGSGGIAGSPIESALPGEQIYDEHVNPDGSNSSGGGFGSDGQLGALNPGRGTAVGGNIEGSSTFASTNTSVHFVVESTQPAYWRTGAYSEYTGTGWRQSGDTSPLDGSIQHEGISDEEIVYDLTLERPSAAVPTPWRPITVNSDEDLVVTDDAAVLGTQRFEAGTTFSGVSHQPERDPTLLRTSGWEYSTDVSAFTELPDGTPRRVDRFTDELTTDADSPYEAATAIQEWLRSEKGYSLSVSRQSDTIADTFIFDMNRGYCEYFATAMTVMLRTQDIPARYVVGYSTGQRVGENRYEVMGMNAHAWVEVYFEDFGWVKFDPTPGDSRLAAQQAALEEANRDSEYETENVGSPGEVFEPGVVRQLEEDLDSDLDNATDDGNDTTDDSEDGQGYDISFDPQPIPGESVTVTLTFDGAPAEGREIYFNGRRIGVTNSSGMVTGTVPASDELVVDVRRGNTTIDLSEPDGIAAVTSPAPDGITAVTRPAPDGITAVTSPAPDGITAVTSPAPGGLTAGRQSTRLGGGPVSPTSSWAVDDPSAGTTSSVDQVANESEETFVVPVETNASLLLSGDMLPGSEITVTALVGDVPLSNAAVTLDGDLYGRTDENGRARLLLPSDSGEKTLAVRRDPVTGNTSIAIPALELTVESDLPVTLPYGSVTVEASYGNRTVVGAPVFLDGEEVARTGQDGTATFRLPPAETASIAVTDNGVRTSKTVGGMLRHLLGGVLAILLLAGSVVYGVRRTTVLQQLQMVSISSIRRVLAGVTGAIVVIATRRGTYAARFIERVRITIRYLVRTATGRTSLGETLTALQAWAASRYLVVTAAVRRPAETTTSAGRREETIASVQDGWRDFLEYVSVGEPANRTPGEIARHAIDRDGLPPEAVATLRDSFREVEYGSRPAEERVDQVRAALAEIRGRIEGHHDPATGGRE